MSEGTSRERWQEDRTTFQRVYDVLVGTQSPEPAATVAERADCSETTARRTLEQLAEMGIADRRDGRPVTYRRNNSYFEWKRIESLASDHDTATLQERLQELIDEDVQFQEQYDVPTPDSVSTAAVPVSDHERVEAQWEDLNEWRTIRRDIRLLRRAIDRTQNRTDDGIHA